MRRVVFLAALLPVAVLVGWLLFRGRGDPDDKPATGEAETGDRQPSGQASPGSAPRPAPRAPRTPTARPALPGDDAGAPAVPFADEVRDPPWADEHEQEIRERVAAVVGGDGSVRLDRVDCRSRRCELVVTGEHGDAFDQALAAFGDDRGFHGWATQLMLRDLRRDGERASVTVVLWF